MHSEQFRFQKTARRKCSIYGRLLTKGGKEMVKQQVLGLFEEEDNAQGKIVVLV